MTVRRRSDAGYRYLFSYVFQYLMDILGGPPPWRCGLPRHTYRRMSQPIQKWLVEKTGRSPTRQEAVLNTRSVIAANRFGLGARPGDLDRIDRNPRGWLLDQLPGPSRTPAEFAELPATPELVVEARDIRRMQRGRPRGDSSQGEPYRPAHSGLGIGLSPDRPRRLHGV